MRPRLPRKVVAPTQLVATLGMRPRGPRVFTTMVTATLNGTTIAASDSTVVVEGNHYFPPDSVNWEHFVETDLETGCPWKGTASYYSITVSGETLSNLAWTYHEPSDAAAEIKDHRAFYPQVSVA